MNTFFAKNQLDEYTLLYAETLREIEEYYEENPEEQGEDIPQEFLDKLDTAKNNIDKVLEYLYYSTKALDKEIEAIKEEHNRLTKRRLLKESMLEFQKGLVKEIVLSLGERQKSGSISYKNSLHKFTFVKTKPVLVTAEEAVPSRFKSFEFSVDKLKAENLKLLRDHLMANSGLYKALTEEGKLNIEPKLDKRAIKTAIEQGEKIPGVALDEEAGYIRLS